MNAEVCYQNLFFLWHLPNNLTDLGELLKRYIDWIKLLSILANQSKLPANPAIYSKILSGDIYLDVSPAFPKTATLR